MQKLQIFVEKKIFLVFVLSSQNYYQKLLLLKKKIFFFFHKLHTAHIQIKTKHVNI